MPIAWPEMYPVAQNLGGNGEKSSPSTRRISWGPGPKRPVATSNYLAEIIMLCSIYNSGCSRPILHPIEYPSIGRIESGNVRNPYRWIIRIFEFANPSKDLWKNDDCQKDGLKKTWHSRNVHLSLNFIVFPKRTCETVQTVSTTGCQTQKYLSRDSLANIPKRHGGFWGVETYVKFLDGSFQKATGLTCLNMLVSSLSMPWTRWISPNMRLQVAQNIHKTQWRRSSGLVDHFNNWMLYERTSPWVIDFPTFSETRGSTAMATCNALPREGFLCLDIMWKSHLRCSFAPNRVVGPWVEYGFKAHHFSHTETLVFFAATNIQSAGLQDTEFLLVWRLSHLRFC